MSRHSNRHAPRDIPEAQGAFKVLMITWILQFARRIAFRCVLHRCGSQDIRRWKLYGTFSQSAAQVVLRGSCENARKTRPRSAAQIGLSLAFGGRFIVGLVCMMCCAREGRLREHQEREEMGDVIITLSKTTPPRYTTLWFDRVHGV